jgi:hypothetical protein
MEKEGAWAFFCVQCLALSGFGPGDRVFRLLQALRHRYVNAQASIGVDHSLTIAGKTIRLIDICAAVLDDFTFQFQLYAMVAIAVTVPVNEQFVQASTSRVLLSATVPIFKTKNITFIVSCQEGVGK